MNLHFQFFLLMLAGWVNRRQQFAIEYLQAENRALREQLGLKRIRWTEAQRRRLAENAKAVGRDALKQLETIVSPDTLLRWYRRLVAAKYDGSAQRGPGRPRVKKSITDLVLEMARDNPTWGYNRIRCEYSSTCCEQVGYRERDLAKKRAAFHRVCQFIGDSTCTLEQRFDPDRMISVRAFETECRKGHSWDCRQYVNMVDAGETVRGVLAEACNANHACCDIEAGVE